MIRGTNSLRQQNASKINAILAVTWSFIQTRKEKEAVKSCLQLYCYTENKTRFFTK